NRGASIRSGQRAGRLDDPAMSPLGLDPQLFQLADLSLPLCLPLDDEFSVPTCRAVMREAEKVERLRSPLADPETPFGSVFAEHDQPGLFLMKRKAELGQSLGEVDHHLPRVRLA